MSATGGIFDTLAVNTFGHGHGPGKVPATAATGFTPRFLALRALFAE
jgi:hypothetical protein